MCPGSAGIWVFFGPNRYICLAARNKFKSLHSHLAHHTSHMPCLVACTVTEVHRCCRAVRSSPIRVASRCWRRLLASSSRIVCNPRCERRRTSLLSRAYAQLLGRVACTFQACGDASMARAAATWSFFLTICLSHCPHAVRFFIVFECIVSLGELLSLRSAGSFHLFLFPLRSWYHGTSFKRLLSFYREARF